MEELQQIEIGAGTAVRITQAAMGIRQAQREYEVAISQALTMAGQSANGNPWDLKVDGDQAYLVEMGQRPPKPAIVTPGGEDGEEA